MKNRYYFVFSALLTTLLMTVLNHSQPAFSQTTINNAPANVSQTQNLIRNGDFEASVPDTQNSSATPQALSLKDWLVYSSELEYFTSGISSSGLSSGEPQNHYIGIKSKATQETAEMTAGYSGMSQAVKTVAGRKYQLSFMLKAVTSCPGPLPLGVVINGNLHRYSIGNASTWLPYTIEFVARNNTSLIEFVGLGSHQAQCMTALDNVAVVESVQNSPKHFEGNWQTTWGVLTIKMNGQHVTGSYPHDQGRIDGTVSEDGMTFTGTWSEAPNYAPPNDAGPLILRLSQDKSSFEGEWEGNNSTTKFEWAGKRIVASEPVSRPIAPSKAVATEPASSPIAPSKTLSNPVSTPVSTPLAPSTTSTKPAINHNVPRHFEGDWQTTWGLMTLKMNGQFLTGFYTHDQGRLDGTVSEDGRTFTGTWSEAPSYAPPDDAGPVIFKLSSDNMTFEGKYSQRANQYNWTGRRIVATEPTISPSRVISPVSTPASRPVSPATTTKPAINHNTPRYFEGDWQTVWGVMTLKTTGRNVKGYYTHDQGRIDGTLSGDGMTVTGTWSEAPSYSSPNDAGRVIFQLSPDHRTFMGKWGYGNQPLKDNWQGTRIQSKRY